MPKEQLSISRFEGGLVDEIDDRDLPENSVSEISNLRVDKPGQLSLIPESVVHGEFHVDNFGAFEAEVTPGFGAHEWASDIKVDLHYRAITVATGNDGSGADSATTITTSGTHSLSVGDEVRIVGSYNKAYDGYFRVLITGTNTFVINKAFGSGQSSQDIHVFKIGLEKDHQHHFLAIQDNNNISIYDNQSLNANAITLGNAFGNALGGSAATGDSSNVHTDFVDVDGILRISDGNFSNRNNVYPRWYGYIPARPIGDYSDLRGTLAAFTGSNITVSNTGAGADGLAVGKNFDAVESSGAGDNLVYSDATTADIGVHLTNGRKVNVSFNMIEFSSDYSTTDTEGVGQYPAVYFGNASGILPDGGAAADAAGTNRNSDIFIAKPGLNHFEFTIKNSGPEEAYLIFYNTHKCSYKIRGVRIVGNQLGVSLGGFPSGYYDLPSNCFEPGRSEIQSSLEVFNTDKGNIIGYVDNSAGAGDIDAYDTDDSVQGPDPDGQIGALYMAIGADNESGDWYASSDHKYLQFGMTWIYDGSQESRMNPYNNKIVNGAAKTQDYYELDSGGGDETAIQATIEFCSWPANPRITGARIYVIGYGKTAGEAQHIIADPLLLATVDAVSSLQVGEHGSVTWCDGRVTPILASNFARWKAEHNGLKEFPSLTYKIVNGYDAYDNLEARWSHSVVVNRRLYAANVRQKTASTADLNMGTAQNTSEYKNYPDRILRSPVNKFDILPSRSEITVASNDGQTIQALKAYKGKLLQFKEETIYIINVSEDFEYLEDQIEGIGVKRPDAVCDTDIGVAWTSHKGVYLYDGQKIVELTDGKIDQTTWFDFVGWNGGRIGYSQRDQALLVYSDNTDVNYIFSMKSQSWTKGKANIPDAQRLSNAVNWHWSTGIFWVAQANSNTNGESISVVESTSYTPGTPASAQVLFNGGQLTTGHEFWIKDSGNTARVITKSIGSHLNSASYNASSKADGLVDLFNAYNGAYGVNATSSYSNIVSPDGYESINLTAREYGTHMNASGSATDNELGGLFVDDNGSASSELASKGGMSNATIIPFSGGVNCTPQVVRYYVNRAGSTANSVDYILELVPLLPSGDAIPGDLGSEQIIYTTASSPDSEAVVDGLIANIPQGLEEYFTFVKGQEAATDEWYLQLTGNYVNNTSTATQNTYGAYRVYTFAAYVKNTAIEMHRWHMGYKDGSNSSMSNVQYISKDIDFGAPAVRKKVYKFYVTYKSTGDTNILPFMVANGLEYNNTNRKTFADSTYYTDADGLKSTAGKWQIVELKPDSTSDFNNLYSVKFVLDSKGHVPKDFMINDVTVVYRVKSVK